MVKKVGRVRFIIKIVLDNHGKHFSRTIKTDSVKEMKRIQRIIVKQNARTSHLKFRSWMEVDDNNGTYDKWGFWIDHNL